MLDTWTYLTRRSDRMNDRETVYRAGYDADGHREFTFARYLSNGTLALAVAIHYSPRMTDSGAAVMWSPVRPEGPTWLPCGREGTLGVEEWWTKIETHCLFQYAWDPSVGHLSTRLRAIGLEFLGLGNEVMQAL